MIRYATGFEGGVIPPGFNTGTASVTVTCDASVKRSGGFAYKATNSSGNNDITLPGYVAAAADDEAIIGFGWHSTIIENNRLIMGVQVGASAWVCIGSTTAGAISSQTYSAASATSGTALGTSASGVVTANTWHYILVRVKPHASTGILEVWVDGVRVLNLTNIDTLHASAVADTARNFTTQRANGNTSLYLDDILIADNTGTGVVAVFGPVSIEAIRPAGDVAETWDKSTGADSYALVDEAPASAADYVETTVAGELEEWSLADRTHTGGVLGVVAWAQALNPPGAAPSLKLGFRRGGSHNQSAARGVPGEASVIVGPLAEVDPATGVAFTTANVNALTLTAEAA